MIQGNSDFSGVKQLLSVVFDLLRCIWWKCTNHYDICLCLMLITGLLGRDIFLVANCHYIYNIICVNELHHQ